MVDFQSRDTQRGHDEAPDDEEAVAEAPADEVPADDETLGSDDAESEPEDAPQGVAVVTVGGNRSVEEDALGDAVVEEVEAAGGTVVTRELIGADFDGVQQTVDALSDRGDVYAVVTTGGTGVEPDDVTAEAVGQMFQKELPGFGELVRQWWYDEAGSAVIRTRATAGILDGVPCFCLPGDAAVVRQSVRDIIVPEAETLAALATPDETDAS